MNILHPKPFHLKSVAHTFICSVFSMLLIHSASAQSTRNLALAEKYFAAGDYYTAAGLYEQYLNPVKKTVPRANFPLNAKRFHQAGTNISLSKTDVLFKQAESYRLANYLKEAAEKYKQCLDKDAAKYADAQYWYAVCQRGLSDYAQAEESLNKYLAGDGSNNHYTAAAKKELETVKFINEQLKRPDLVMYKVALLNTSFGSEKGVYAPALVNSNQFVFTSTDKDTSVKTGVNPYHNRMYKAVVSSSNIEISDVMNVEGADIIANQGTASVSADGNTVYFTQWNKANGKGNAAIYYAVKKGNDWGNAQPLTSVNVSGSNSKQPYCSPDGKTLFFASDRQGGAGGFDIWSASINSDGTTGTPVNLAAINSENNEQAPFFHAGTGTLVFSGDGRIGMGGYDLFSATFKDGQWTAPKNMGYPVNSSRDDVYFFAPEGEALLKNSMFSSDRGAGCCLETYMVSKTPKKKFITGLVKDSKDNAAIENALVVMKGPDGNPVEAATDKDGKFSFEYTGDVKQNNFTVTKEKYKDKNENVQIEKVDETDWSSDYVFNAPILMDRKLVIKPETVVTVYFDFDKHDLKQRSVEVLDSIYNVLSQTPAATIQISGYTDGLGTDEYNKILADKRAKACADYLIAKGIDASRITFESFGECCPVEMELINGRDNPNGRSKNRRALINITME